MLNTTTEPKIGQPVILDSNTITWRLVKDTISKTATEEEDLAAIKKQGIAYSTKGIEVAKSIPAIVPGTVLNSLLRDKDWLKTNLKNQKQLAKEGKNIDTDFFDPFFDTNQTFIPDVFDKGIDFYTYWYYTEFTLETAEENQHFWLNFRGINYTADFFVNGIQIQQKEEQEEDRRKGMFLRHSLDITNCTSSDGIYRVAVRIVPPDTPGKPILTNNGGDLHQPNIGECVTMRHTVGWDWTISIPDRSTGIWDQVSVSTTKALVIKHPKVITKINGTIATVYIHAHVYNPTSMQQTGFLSYDIEGKTQQKAVSIEPGKTVLIDFLPLEISNARLWWPHGTDPRNPENAPELYELNLYTSITKELVATSLSDQQTLKIGMREFSNKMIQVNAPDNGKRESRQFFVNGLPIMIRGGNWMGMDTLFRGDATRYKNEVRMHKEMNLNLIRVWGGGHIERPEFYEACDELGIMVMQEFWFSSEFKFPESDPKFENYKNLCFNSIIDTIQMLRNHASLLFWCAANESIPPLTILEKMLSYIGEKTGTLDDTRILIPNSRNIYLKVTPENFNTNTGNDDGPYGILELNNYFKWLPGGYNNSFNPEIGSLGIPTVESLQQIIRTENLISVPKKEAIFKKPKPGDAGYETHKDLPVVNESWQQLKYSQYMIDYNVDTFNDQIYTYGVPKDIEGYCERAQLANYLHYKELWEGYLTHMWEWYTGLIIWKSQGCWTGVRAKLYDWFLEQNGGHWGVKNACEPIHVQLNLENYPTGTSYDVNVVNHTSQKLTNLQLNLEIYDIKGSINPKNSPTKKGDEPYIAHKSCTTKITTLDFKETLNTLDSNTYFVILKLEDKNKTLSRNCYWLSKTGQYVELDTYINPKLMATAKGQKTINGVYTLQTLFKNNATQLSFWNRLQIRKACKEGEKSERVLPVFYEKNYFSLTSQEKESINIDFQHDFKEGIPELWIKGWNQKWVQIPIDLGK